MFKRMSVTVVFVMLIASVLTACGGPAPVTLSSLPVFTGATATTNDVLSAALTAATDEMKKTPNVGNVEAKAYDLPADTTFDAVAAFYKGALEKGGWAVGIATSPSLGYTRGSQALNITYMEGVGMMVMLSTVK
jgi:hypothetical protein